MSKFEVPVFAIDNVEDIPGKDNIGIVRYKDYQMIVRKDSIELGAPYAYIPEAAIVPESILSELGLSGKLAGKDGNRVKAVRIGGVLSQGLCYPLKMDRVYVEDEDVSEYLGITKYEPPVPIELSGKIAPDGPLKDHPHFHSYTDIENVKKWPGIFRDDEIVVATEKLHGTCHICGIIDGEFFVTSKGIAQKGWTLAYDPANAYWKQAEKSGLEAVCREIMKFGHPSVILFGEMIGVQDLRYGLKPGETDYRLFDIAVGGKYLSFPVVELHSRLNKLPIVPFECLRFVDAMGFVSGLTEVGGNPDQIREGLVIRPFAERYDEKLGRVILKAISEEYLTRRNGTEYN